MDIEGWEAVWSRCRLDGVILAIEGPFSPCRTRIPLAPVAHWAEDGDPFGDWIRAARRHGLGVLVEMDPSRALPEVYFARPDWFFLGADGRPRRSNDPFGSFHTCINTAYAWEQVPALISEWAERYEIDGILGARWEGYGESDPLEPCHCSACLEKFNLQRGGSPPSRIDPKSAQGRDWIAWRNGCAGEARRHWDDTLKLHRRDIAFLGLDSIDPSSDRADGFVLRLPEESDLLIETGFASRLLHSLSDGRRRSILSIPIVETDRRTHRPGSQMESLLALSSAAGVAPCIDFGSAAMEDRRGIAAVEAFANRFDSPQSTGLGDILESAASVAVVVSGSTIERPGGSRFHAAARGAMLALSSAAIPHDILLDRHLSRSNLSRYRAIVLPDLTDLSEEQCDLIWEFGSDGGGIVATFRVSTRDEAGNPRDDFGLTDRLGVKLMRPMPVAMPDRSSFFRIVEPHESLDAFSETSLLPGGGRYLPVELRMDHRVPLTVHISEEPLKSMGASREAIDGSEAAAMVLGPSGKGRIVYFPTEPDRLYWRTRRPDHARLLVEALRWAHRSPLPIELTGPGACEVIAGRTAGDLILHIINVSPAGWPAAPLVGKKVSVCDGERYVRADLPMSGGEAEIVMVDDAHVIRLPEIACHEVVVLRSG